MEEDDDPRGPADAYDRAECDPVLQDAAAFALDAAGAHSRTLADLIALLVRRQVIDREDALALARAAGEGINTARPRPPHAYARDILHCRLAERLALDPNDPRLSRPDTVPPANDG